ncbi:MAG: hypothetical protein F6J90_13500 [Moorea sp. SIOASIH]|uniref:hypothetical protein n=1 Tax=Moorena sp. SIOASIH TaxID=2607817 RepID=UPI0013B78F23|nr:hypothetical protein [Moorena sp. SIOASIH]NEO37282.1 hypothetical protein [Moorena sp. SIOASIH]NEO96535.1 hypothetical protein [Moorena sp. SIO3G5]
MTNYNKKDPHTQPLPSCANPDLERYQHAMGDFGITELLDQLPKSTALLALEVET